MREIGAGIREAAVDASEKARPRLIEEAVRVETVAKYVKEAREIRSSPNDRTVTLVVKSTLEILSCRICNKPTRGHGLGRPLNLRHVPLLGKETYIEIRPRSLFK